MSGDPGDLPHTRPLDEFIAEFERDNNAWWREPQGDLMNHFEALLAQVAAVEAVADEVWADSQGDDMIIRDAGIMQDVVERFRAAIKEAKP